MSNSKVNDLVRKSAAINALAENYGKLVSDALLKMWLKLLEPYSADQVAEAAVRVIAEYQYATIPPFAILKEYLDYPGGSKKALVSKEMQAEAEWGNLLQDLQSLGFYKGPPENMHPTTLYVLRNMGGWAAACAWDAKNMEWRRKEFIDKWLLSDGHVDAMMLGASTVAEIGRSSENGPEKASETMKKLSVARKALPGGKKS